MSSEASEQRGLHAGDARIVSRVVRLLHTLNGNKHVLTLQPSRKFTIPHRK